jgi:ADP-heptose:LPS heptosyltransferase
MTTRKVLVVRNDRLGDFMLAWPAFALLKSSLPGHRIEALVPEYTRALAEFCPWLDGVLIDPAADARGWRLSRLFRERSYDAILTLFSSTRVGFAAWRARIPTRIAPATKLAQIFYNHKVRQRRSRSEKPEFAYNLALAEHLLGLWKRPARHPTPPYLRFETAEIADARHRFLAAHALDPQRRLVFLHAGSGGSAKNLSIPQYATLASNLGCVDGLVLVLCAAPNELAQARQLAALLDQHARIVFESREGLVNYARHIAFADLFISGSTGPLHIAGALNRPTAAFYPRRRSATALRWQTLNEEDRRLAFSPPAEAEESDMSAIDVHQAAEMINRHLLARSFTA